MATSRVLREFGNSLGIKKKYGEKTQSVSVPYRGRQENSSFYLWRFSAWNEEDDALR